MGYKKSPTHCVPGGKWLGHTADQSHPMQLYLCSPTYHLGVHKDITFYYKCQLQCLLQIRPKTHNEHLSTLTYAGTNWVTYAHPTSNYHHVTFMYKTCGKVNTQWSYSCPCAQHKGVWKTGRTAPLTSELNRGERSASCHSRFTTGERTPVFTVQDAGRAPQSVCTLWNRGKSLAPTKESIYQGIGRFLGRHTFPWCCRCTVITVRSNRSQCTRAKTVK